MVCVFRAVLSVVLGALSVCYTEKASPTRHRPERQHNARSNRRKQCSPNETKPCAWSVRCVGAWSVRCVDWADWVDCRCFLSFVYLGDARRLELSPCNTQYGNVHRIAGEKHTGIWVHAMICQCTIPWIKRYFRSLSLKHSPSVLVHYDDAYEPCACPCRVAGLPLLAPC